MAPRAGLASHRKALSLHAICVAGGIEVPVLVPANESYAVPAGLRDRLFLLRDGNNPISNVPDPAANHSARLARSQFERMAEKHMQRA